MTSSRHNNPRRIIVDSIHGDIAPSDIEWRVLNTASFQRLRHIKQLGMAHYVYPNATHTRFAHSLGVLGIMARVLRVVEERESGRPKEEFENLRLAALLHDIGHYPYSHLMEKLGKVKLTEEFVGDGQKSKQVDASQEPFPRHDELGKTIVTHQDDLLQALGGKNRAEAIAALFCRSEAADLQWSKLINSSLDMDRLDYLLRDSNATGVPYGQIDINYLLNNLEVSKNGLLGVTRKALCAAEQFLFARYFMHRTVYFHKTTFALEEACRHLLRRISDARMFNFPVDGKAIQEIAKGEKLLTFTDAFVDDIIRQAALEEDEVISSLAKSILNRRPPKLLKEVSSLVEGGHHDSHPGSTFTLNCRHQLKALADKHSLPLGRFVLGETPPISLAERAHLLTAEQAQDLPPEEADPDIKVFLDDQSEPVSIVDVPESLVNKCSNYRFRSVRLYFVGEGLGEGFDVNQIRGAVSDWDKS